MEKGLAGWNSAVAGAIDALGSAEFPARIEMALRRLVDFDILMVFAYSGPDKPLCPYHNITPSRAETVIDAYVSGPYLLDPFYTAAMDAKVFGLRRLKDMAPDQFYSSEYFRQHYELTGIRDEVGIVCRPAHWTGVVVSFTRPVGAPAFGRRDLALIRDAEPVIRSLCERHWAADASAPRSREEAGHPRNPINDTLNRMTNGILTPREIETTSLILRGHSNASISERLAIAEGTVKIHRKNIYQKLDVSSQAELFAMFIQQMSGP